MKINIIKAESDLGVHVDGANLGPKILTKNIKNDNVVSIIEVLKNDIKKSHDKLDLKKNLNEVNIFNEKLYNMVYNTLTNNLFPITIGGDHSIAIGSALASKAYNKNIGIIWVDAHLDYNTFKTTITGNLHGLPLAALNGLCEDLTMFYKDSFYNPRNTVVVGYRSIETNKESELNNIKKMGVTVFTTEDIKKEGIKAIMQKAFTVASLNTNGIHISYDLDVIDPIIAPGVSIPEINGINETEAYSIMNEIINNNEVKSLDLVEFNPANDINNKTYNIANKLLNMFLNK